MNDEFKLFLGLVISGLSAVALMVAGVFYETGMRLDHEYRMSQVKCENVLLPKVRKQ